MQAKLKANSSIQDLTWKVLWFELDRSTLCTYKHFVATNSMGGIIPFENQSPFKLCVLMYGIFH